MNHSPINLLPPPLKQLNRIVFRLDLVSRLLAGVVILSLLAVVAVVAIRLTIDSSMALKQADLKNLQQQIDKLSEIERQIATINERVQQAAKLTQKQIAWPSILQVISEVTPAGVKLNTIKMQDQLDKTWELTGTSLDERTMLAFQAKLEASALFANATITNTALAQGKDKTTRSFTINFQLENKP